ncbi:MAG: LysR family transcriptional regulator [Pseudomonadota bacterium]
MINPQHLAIFAAIVKGGSISAAAKELGQSKSVLSRQLARLEEDLGARLIQRSTRRLALTEIGALVLGQARQIDQALANIGQLTDQHQQQVRGLLRVSCSMAGRGQVVPLLVQFTQRYPDVKVALQLDDRLVDLIEEQIDVAIRVSVMADSSLIARKLVDNPRVLVAAPSYIARAGAPHTPQQLAGHACLLYASGARVFDEWTFIGEQGPYQVRVAGPIQVNDGGALVTSAVAGGGIVLTSRRMVVDELASGALVELLPQFALLPAPPIFAVYPARDWLAPKTSAFIAFLQERLGTPA